MWFRNALKNIQRSVERTEKRESCPPQDTDGVEAQNRDDIATTLALEFREDGH